jgi:hypothetical protein
VGGATSISTILLVDVEVGVFLPIYVLILWKKTHQKTTMEKKGQTQCQRLPHEWGLGKEITEAKSYPHRNSTERQLRTQDLVVNRYFPLLAIALPP